MIKYIIISSLLILNACAIPVDVSDSKHDANVTGGTESIVSGEVTFNVGFDLDEIIILCENLYYEIPNVNEREKLVSECVFEKLSILNVDLQDLLDQIDNGEITIE